MRAHKRCHPRGSVCSSNLKASSGQPPG
jgi:hypothetical protein